MSEPLHPNNLRPQDLEWLLRQDKAMLVEVIGQLVWAFMGGRAMLDEAILRAHQNRLQVQADAAFEKVQAFQPSEYVGLPTAKWKAAWEANSRHEREWRRLSEALTKSFSLQRGARP